MPDYSISAYGLDQVVFVGPDPFMDQAGRNMAALNNTIIQVRSGERPTTFDITDDDTHFHDQTQEVSAASTLTNQININGEDYGAGSVIQNEYTYIIRPQGSTSSTDDIRIHVMRIDGEIAGFAFSAPLTPGINYVVRSGGSDQPGHAYSTYAVVCFTPGTLIATPRGPRLVESLMPGDLVQTRDNGAQPVQWVFGRAVAGTGRNAPVCIRAGVLGNRRDLLLSPQHRVLVDDMGEESLVPVKALVDGRGIVTRPMRTARYLHLLTQGHQVLSAEGAAVESLLPGKMALASLDPQDRDMIRQMMGPVGWEPTRPLLTAGDWRRRPLARAGQGRFPGGRRGGKDQANAPGTM